MTGFVRFTGALLAIFGVVALAVIASHSLSGGSPLGMLAAMLLANAGIAVVYLALYLLIAGR